MDNQIKALHGQQRRRSRVCNEGSQTANEVCLFFSSADRTGLWSHRLLFAWKAGLLLGGRWWGRTQTPRWGHLASGSAPSYACQLEETTLGSLINNSLTSIGLQTSGFHSDMFLNVSNSKSESLLNPTWWDLTLTKAAEMNGLIN